MIVAEDEEELIWEESQKGNRRPGQEFFDVIFEDFQVLICSEHRECLLQIV